MSTIVESLDPRELDLDNEEGDDVEFDPGEFITFTDDIYYFIGTFYSYHINVFKTHYKL